MFLISNGDTDAITKAIIVWHEDDISQAIREVMVACKCGYDQIVVNPLGQPLSEIPTSLLPDDMLANDGFTADQIAYLKKAERLIVTGTSSVKEIQDELGYGVVDEAILRDTFFPS